MITTPFSGRPAERFNDLLEDDRTNTHNELSPLLSLTQQMESIGSTVRADDDFREQFRTRLLAVAAVQGVGNEAAIDKASIHKAPRRHYQGLRRRQEGRRVPRRAAVLTGTLAALVGLSSVGMASSSAMPGDTFYNIKLGKEATQLAFARSELSRGQLYMHFARTRLDEAQNLARGTEIGRALEAADSNTRSAMHDMGEAAVNRNSTTPLDYIDRFVSEQRSDLQSWAGELPPNKRTRAAESVALLDQVGERSRGLRVSLSCSHGNAGSSTSDALGPLPRACAPAREEKTIKPDKRNDGGPAVSHSPTPTPAEPSSDTPNAPQPSPTPSEHLPLPQNPGVVPKLLVPGSSSQTPKPQESGKDLNNLLGGIFTEK